ncbi:MAG: hypothetical protein KKG47_09070 [Proteobacteria bacterium]|nr:hypothetical protein [Pseudomonadota bacterium]MBU1739025.1 hypothetical protein [Pseudomonadota bacterium]
MYTLPEKKMRKDQAVNALKVGGHQTRSSLDQCHDTIRNIKNPATDVLFVSGTMQTPGDLPGRGVALLSLFPWPEKQFCSLLSVYHIIHFIVLLATASPQLPGIPAILGCFFFAQAISQINQEV